MVAGAGRSSRAQADHMVARMAAARLAGERTGRIAADPEGAGRTAVAHRTAVRTVPAGAAVRTGHTAVVLTGAVAPREAAAPPGEAGLLAGGILPVAADSPVAADPRAVVARPGGKRRTAAARHRLQQTPSCHRSVGRREDALTRARPMENASARCHSLVCTPSAALRNRAISTLSHARWLPRVSAPCSRPHVR